MKRGGGTLSGNAVLIARQILRHLLECPDAVDTAAGIFQWWLRASPDLTDPAELEEILNIMVEQGWLVTRAGSPASLYGVNESRIEGIVDFLKTTSEEETRWN